ncbi:GntR family transcriptional regulator [Ottowia pentelensis]|uniref:GntR family transcriptional regulator n=1 Tax=Ottowia pentelensis TaxID=511108 RepID=A0ABV6PNA4_9BURK
MRAAHGSGRIAALPTELGEAHEPTRMETFAASAPVKSLTAVAFERLRVAILCGELLPQERLRIQALSERYSVGATAVREALSRLVTEGLVALEEQRGFHVTPVSRAELLDLAQTRSRVEQMALREAIAHGDIEWESRLLSCFHRLSRTPPPTSPERDAPWSAAHRAFHEALVDGCASPWTLRLCGLLYDKSERYRNLAKSSTHERGRDVDGEHRALLDAAMTRDADAACRLLGEHFAATTEIILAGGLVSDE